MKNILVATDLSARSDRALLRGVKLAKKFQAKLTIINVIDDQMPSAIIAESKNISQKEINLCLKGKTAGIDIETRIVAGNPYIEIIKASYEINAELIIVGLHRHVDNKEPIIGSVIQRLIKSANKPILVVKNRSEIEYKNIISCLDLNVSSVESLNIALNLFNNAKFYLLHSYNVPFLGFMGKSSSIEQEVVQNCQEELQEIVTKLRKNIKSDNNIEIEEILKSGYILDVLQEEAAHIKPDLLVFGTKSRTGFSRSIMPSASESVLIDPACDVLLFGSKH